MRIIDVDSMESIAAMIPQLVHGDVEFLIHITQPRESVIVGSADDVNMDEVKKRGLFVTQIGTVGGTIVMNTGDVGLALYGKLYPVDRLFENALQAFLSFLNERGVPAELVDNDVVVDGHKCCAISRNEIANDTRVLYLFQISVNIDLDAIRAICKKQMVKVPCGLAEYGVSTDDVNEWFARWLATRQAAIN